MKRTVYAHILLFIAVLYASLCLVNGATSLATNVHLIPETGLTWTTQQTLTLVSTITITSSTLSMDSISIYVDRGGETMTGKLYDAWTTTNLTFALNGTGNKDIALTGLTSDVNYHIYRDGALLYTMSTAGTTTLNFTVTLGSEHVFKVIKYDPGGSSGSGGSTGSGGDDEEEPGDGEDDGIVDETGETGEDGEVTGESRRSSPSDSWHPGEPILTPGVKTNWYAVGVAFAVPYIYFRFLKKNRR